MMAERERGRNGAIGPSNRALGGDVVGAARQPHEYVLHFGVGPIDRGGHSSRFERLPSMGGSLEQFEDPDT